MKINKQEPKSDNKISTIFLDIGGVLLTGGWDRQARHRAVNHFGLDEEEINERHHLTFDTFESGKLTLDEYLDRVAFYQPRNFSKEDFKKFMFAQSLPVEDSLGYFKALKVQHKLKIIALNNEAKELNEFRVKKYGLDQLFDAFVSSCYVHLRKPDSEIFRMASDIAQSSFSSILYIDDRLMFVEVANSLGIRGYHFQGLEALKAFMQTIRFS
jgi:putative hydrolase of the HAD superfamily